MSVDVTLAWTTGLLALSLLLQTLELCFAREQIAVSFPWRIVRRDYGLRALDWVLADGRWPWLLPLHAALACALALSPHPLWPWLTLCVELLFALRFRGSFNGGADAMTLVALLGVALARSLQDARIGLGYIAAQLVLSYALAGLWKLRAPDWRNGSALLALARAPQYAGSRTLSAVAEHHALSRALGYLVITFECAFPLALLDVRLAIALCTTGLLFHLGNAVALGLNRFVWAWVAGYPALMYWSLQTVR